MATSKKEFILEGLDCANCAAKIEGKLNACDSIDSCTVNFSTKTATIHFKNSDETAATNDVKQIVKDTEPDVLVIDKNDLKTIELVYDLNGLDCANCAAKIEEEVKKIAGVSNAQVNFATRRLSLHLEDEDTSSVTENKIVNIVKQLEPEVDVIKIKESSKADIVSNHHLSDIKPTAIRLVVSIGIMTVGYLMSDSAVISFFLFFVSYLLAGYDVLLKATKNITRGKVFDENFLMMIATIGAFIIGEYPEGVAVMLFYQIGEMFQKIAVNKSRKSIADLMDIRPDVAVVFRNGEYVSVSPQRVAIGETILVKPGEKIPLDGKIITGSTFVDTSNLTGESVPREVSVGNDVLSGFVNKNGVVTIEVTKEFGESTVSKILELVQNASNRKAPTENFITKFAKYYTPAVVITAIILALVPPVVLPGASFSEWIYRALVFLVISCPCALVVSIPLSFFGGIGAASRKGILIKGSNYLEALNDVKYIVFDKTGTLTKGVFKVTETKPENGYTNDQLLEYAAYAESYSNHPIAASILNEYDGSVDKNKVQSYEEVAGHGTIVEYENNKIYAGNVKLMKKYDINYNPVESIGTIVYIAVNDTFVGSIVISDEIKSDAKSAIAALKEVGIKKTVMLTGDSKTVGNKVGEIIGIDSVHAELLPHQKVEEFEIIDGMKQPHEKVVFVGDGINDTPVLARADIGIAMGGLGSDAAIEAADVVIMNDEPSKIVEAINVAKKTRRIVWQNIIFALGIKGFFLLLGAFGIATMWEAVFADVGVTVLAVINSIRVLKV